MKTRFGIATSLVAAGILGGVAASTATTPTPTLAEGPTSTAADPTGPISADTGAHFGDARYGVDPLVPYGTEPPDPVTPGYVNRNHDEGFTSNGEVDVPS